MESFIISDQQFLDDHSLHKVVITKEKLYILLVF